MRSSSPRARQGLALATLLVGGLLTILIAVVGSQSLRRERDALGLMAVRRAERDRAELARLEAEKRSRVLAETSTDLICVLEPEGAVRYASPACRDLLGLEPEALLGRAFTDLVHEDDAAGVAAVLGARDAGPVSITHRMRRAEGSVWVETRLRVVRDPATRAVVESHATVRDVAERMHSQAALAEAEERFRSAFEEAPIGMALTSPDFRFLRVNRALCQITGYTPAQLEGLPVASITHPDDLKADWEARGAMLEGELSSHRAERRYLHASGSAVWVAINSTLVRDADGKPLHFLSQMQDITERRRHEAELRHMADHDPLTGLLNRRSFERELERHVSYVERYGPKGAAIVLDLDHFKTINDTLGHSAGDELIVRVAHALRSRLRESDVLARLGGDEFAILLPEATPEEADAVAAAVLDAVRTLAVPTATGRTRTVTASLGIALFDSAERLTGEDVLVNADLAMYDAKEAGRDQLAAYDAPERPETRIEARISWADMIRDALAEDAFVLHAQPIVDLATGEATQYELLLRMRGADGELIGPSAFLPVAERFDLMGAIDRWVVARAIRMVGAELRAGRRLVVEVNISGRSAGDPELLELIERRAAHERGLPEPDHLRDHRDDRGLQHPARPALRRPPRRPRLPLRARRLRRRLRLLLLPQAPAVRLPEDRRRVRPPLGRRPHRPARHPGGRRHRPRSRQAHGGRARRRQRDRRAAAPHGRRPRPGLPPRRAGPAGRLAARGRGRADLSLVGRAVAVAQHARGEEARDEHEDQEQQGDEGQPAEGDEDLLDEREDGHLFRLPSADARARPARRACRRPRGGRGGRRHRPRPARAARRHARRHRGPGRPAGRQAARAAGLPRRRGPDERAARRPRGAVRVAVHALRRHPQGQPAVLRRRPPGRSTRSRSTSGCASGSGRSAGCSGR